MAPLKISLRPRLLSKRHSAQASATDRFVSLVHTFGQRWSCTKGCSLTALADRAMKKTCLVPFSGFNALSTHPCSLDREPLFLLAFWSVFLGNPRNNRHKTKKNAAAATPSVIAPLVLMVSCTAFSLFFASTVSGKITTNFKCNLYFSISWW